MSRTLKLLGGACGHALPRTLLLALLVCAPAPVWFQGVTLPVDRLGRWLRRPRAARGLQAGTGVALTARGAALLLEPLPDWRRVSSPGRTRRSWSRSSGA